MWVQTTLCGHTFGRPNGGPVCSCVHEISFLIYFSPFKQDDSKRLFDTSGPDLPWDGEGIMHGRSGVVALVRDCRKDLEGRGPRLVVVLSNVWLRYNAPQRSFAITSHELMKALLHHPLCIEGMFDSVSR